MEEIAGVSRPYHRNCRQFTDGFYTNSGNGRYITHPKYAKSPAQYVRAFLLIQKDLLNLFDYVEPSDTNLECYSFRIHELLLRTCIEIEANFKAVLIENGYEKKNKKGEDLRMNIEDYKKLEHTHKLSDYEIKIHGWHGENALRKPFANWTEELKPGWWVAYNQTKHDRHEKFEQANFENLTNAVCGLIALLSSQFHTRDFSPSGDFLSVGSSGAWDGMESAIGGYFKVKFPVWPIKDQYSFNWEEIKDEDMPFQKIDYSSTI